MALFDKLKDQVKGQLRDKLQNMADEIDPRPKPKQRTCVKLIWSKTFPQSGTFRGYRRIRLSRYYHEEIDATITALPDFNFKGRTIRLDCVLFDPSRADGYRIDVFIDNGLIGSVWQSDGEQYSMLTEYEYDKAYLLVENGTVYLFVRYPGVAPLKVSTEVK